MSQDVRQTSLIVSDIYNEVGTAFTRLGELTMLMHLEYDSSFKDKITDAEMKVMTNSLKKFCEDIEKICGIIKERTLQQIRNSMKRHAYEEAGLPLRKQVITAPKTTVAQERIRNTTTVMPQTSGKSADITLNMLNATEQEVDVEGLSAADKLDYDSVDH